MEFHEQLNDRLTKERGGRHGGKGHEFQRYWAICHLLRSDEEKSDYVMLLEYIEDVAVANSETTPSEIELYQLKKKEGNSSKWSKADLRRIPKSREETIGKSILAKLHESNNALKIGTKSISFVSNAPVKLNLSNGMDSTSTIEFCALELEPNELKDLKESISNELSCNIADVRFERLHFFRSTLAIDDLENHTIGRVTAYLSKKFPEGSAKADVLCKLLYSEIKIKFTTTDESRTFEELKKNRGISRSHFRDMISASISKKTDTELFEEILQNLASENVPWKKRKEIKDESRRFIIDKVGSSNLTLDQLYKKIDIIMESIPPHLEKQWEIALWIAHELAGEPTADIGFMNENYLIAIVLYRMSL